MDLRMMLNEGSAPGKAQQPPPAPSAAPPRPPQHAPHPPPRPGSQHQHPHPQPQQHHHQQQHSLPSTPVQAVPPRPFHDQPQPGQPAHPPPPPRTASREYHAGPQTPFASPPPPPPTYGSSTPFAAPTRPQPPPLQHLSGSVDMRSPSAGPGSISSPYSTSSVRADSAGYPFPSPGHPHPDSASPVQQHRYPPSGSLPPRDSYPQQQQQPGPVASPRQMAHPPPPGYFGAQQQQQQQQHPIPQTPPVGTPGGIHPYAAQQHSRSGSAQSHTSYPPHSFVSPINTNHPQPHSDHMRQPSQPPTPHGPPLSAGPRQSAPPGTFAQPPSPYQQRMSSSSSAGQWAQYPQHLQQSPQQQQQHQLPPPPPSQQHSPHVPSRPQPSPHPAVQRPPSAYDQAPVQRHSVDPQRSSLSQSDRERSVSVSPKTRVPSLPSSAGRHSQASLSGPSSAQPAEFDPRDPRQLPPNAAAPMRDAPVKLEREAPPLSSAVKPERATTPAKRKMDDRGLKPEDFDRQEPRPPPFQANGGHRPGSSSRPAAAHQSDSPMLARRRPRHAAPPPWAVPHERQQLRHPNYLLRKPAAHHAHVNGTAELSSHGGTAARQDRPGSRHVSPETSRSSAAGPPVNRASPAPSVAVHPSKPRLLGPWEPTLANQEPFDELCKTVADFLFLNVVNPPELRELHGRHGINFEIEAKLGTLIERDSAGERFHLPVQSEVALVVTPNPPYNFSSSMTELQHMKYNEYLNHLTTETSLQNPKNKNSPDPRVPINYIHLREMDRHYTPRDARQALHPILQNLIDARGARAPSVRVTTDMKNGGEVVAKIIKVKVADLHIYFPQVELDCRISVNIEANYDGSVEALEQAAQERPGYRANDRVDRHKDRLSYTHGLYKVDLTQVTQPDAGGQSTARKIHELEIELNADAVIDQGRRAMQSQPHNYDFLVEGFVNNIRLLARKSREFQPAQ